MKTHHCEQRTPEWLALREKCLITASEMGMYLTKHDQKSKDACLAVIDDKLAQPIRQNSDLPGYEFFAMAKEKEDKAMEYNPAIQRGNALEPYARAEYERLTGNQVEEIGLITDDSGFFGCSPDGVIYDAAGVIIRGLEIKCPDPKTHLRWMREGTTPREHLPQVHGSMCVSGVLSWDFMSYCPGLPSLLIPNPWDSFTAAMAVGLVALRADYLRQGAELKRGYEQAFGRGGAA